MTASPTSPQLTMWLNSIDPLPPLTPPAGYEVRHYREGDAAAWETIITESFQRPYVFDTLMRADRAFRPERIWFVTRDGIPVATAAAWRRSNWSVDVGYVHMVGALASEAGRGLGALVSLACLHRFKAEGRTHAVLTTDDFRLPAVKTYLKLGFLPLLVHQNQRQRWRDLLPKLGMGELVAKFAPILDGPIFVPGPARPDVDIAE